MNIDRFGKGCFSVFLGLTIYAAPAAALNPATGAVYDIGHMASSPARMESADIYPLAGIIGAGLVLYSLDGQIRHIAASNRTKTLDDISRQAQKLGNGGYDLAIAGAGWLAGKAFSDEKLSRTSMLAAESFLAANGVGTMAKLAAGRSRPYAGDGKDMFRPFTFKTARTSFPSGHTVSAFSVASVYACEYGGWTAAAAYGLAGMVALQRVYADKHWASDVFFGAALGAATGRMVASRGNSPGTARVVPVIGAGYSGAEASVRF